MTSPERSRSPLRGIAAPERTLPALLELQSQRHGGRPLVRRDGVELTVGQLRDIVAGTAGRLAAAGIRPGDAVATMSENRLELLELWLGCAWLGALAVPVNTALRGAQLEHVLRDADVKVALVEPELLPAIDPIAGGLPALEALWRFDEYPGPAAPVPARTAEPERRARSSTPPERPAPRKACCARTRSGTGGGLRPARRWA